MQQQLLQLLQQQSLQQHCFISTCTLDILLLRFESGVVEVTSAIFVNLSRHVDFIIPLNRITLKVPAGSVPILRLPVHGWKLTPLSSENTAFLSLSETLSIKVTF
ncbi:hypothetical protein BN175_1450001 [Clostridioides difficile T23]|nr:hypothetical protein BN173_1840001 [Clostridioides difficile T11]CCL30092.1 hypothetical protein BN174_1770001 [Clostridioides difficile E15]CCL34030.1 hypothetical protein BN175_1450001 [Clostridioides difficile T23]